MNIFSLDSRLSELLFADPAVLPVLSRFGIRLGVGEKSISDICDESGVDPALFLAIVNAWFNKDYFPEDILRKVDLPVLIDYMQQTDIWYAEVQLPNIERHFNILISSSENEASNLKLLGEFFLELKKELMGRISCDERLLFPAVKKGSSVSYNVIDSIIANDSLIEDKLSDLITFFVVHLKGNYNLNLCNAVLQAIFTLERDIQSNNRIRRRILLPSIHLKCLNND